MFRIENLVAPDHPQAEYPQGWLPARPERFHYGILTLGFWADAWAVLRGKAEAVQWPEQRDGAGEREGGSDDEADDGGR